MNWFVLLLLTTILLFIAIEDFRYRAVVWWSFPLLFFFGTIWSLQYVDWKILFRIYAINLSFLVLQLLLITFYFSVRKRVVNISVSLLGFGDILFMACSCCFFSLTVFILFYIFSLIAILILILFAPALKNNGIPLAGLQSVLLILVLGLLLLFKVDPFDDSEILLLISHKYLRFV